MRIVTHSPAETQKLAAKLAVRLLAVARNNAAVVALEGELGAGKTTFTQGLAKALGIKSRITSPTFVLLKHYAIKGGWLYHIDAYRLKNEKDLAALGFKELLRPGNIILIEWADRVAKVLPKKMIKIHIDHLAKNKRRITLSH